MVLREELLEDVVIETRHLYKRFGQITALEDINISITRGEFVAIMGASGSGKTTLINIMACLDAATEGQVLLDGCDAAVLDEEDRRQFRADKIGLVFQQFHLIPYLTALENIMLAQYYHSVVDEIAAKKVLEAVDMASRMGHLPDQLSGGEQQRVCIARAMVNQPPIIFADEPTGNLDEENEQRISALLKDIHRQGRTVVMVTHNLPLACMAERIIRLQHGKYLADNNKKNDPAAF